MSENVLHEFNIRSGLTHSGRECMFETVAAEVWQEHFRIFAFQKLLVVAVPDDSSDDSVQRSVLMDLSVTVQIFRKIIWWLADRLTANDNNFVLEIDLQDFNAYPEDFTFKIKFERIEVVRT